MIHNFLWLDLETTGLDETTGQILEVAAAVVDDGADGTFEVIDAVDTVVLPPPSAGLDSCMDDYVRGMHTRNGLLAAIAAGDGMPLEAADEMLRAFVDQYLAPGEKVILAGASIHFDFRWIKAHMPLLAERLHHRIFDVSTLKAAARVWGPGFTDIKADAHRALADVTASIAEAKAYLDLVRGPA